MRHRQCFTELVGALVQALRALQKVEAVEPSKQEQCRDAILRGYSALDSSKMSPNGVCFAEQCSYILELQDKYGTVRSWGLSLDEGLVHDLENGIEGILQFARFDGKRRSVRALLEQGEV